MSDHVLKGRLQAIQSILMAHHEAGKGIANASKGVERETLIREYFGRLFPPIFRFGSGVIADGIGRQSGQVDIVVEFPFLPSFPTPGSSERLYLADSVAAAIEVKSNLSDLDADAIAKVNALSRSWRAHEHLESSGEIRNFGPSTSRIPYLVVAYRGSITMPRRLGEHGAPDGVLVIESGSYSGCQRVLPESTPASGPAGLLSFACDLAWMIHNVRWASPRIRSYIEECV